MKKFLYLFTVLTIFGLSVPAHAAWQDELRAAVDSGNMEVVNQILAANPYARNEITLSLLTDAQDSLARDPERSLSLYRAALPYMAELATTSPAEVVAFINSMIKTAQDPAFQKANPAASSELLSASLTIASIPTVATASPGLYESVLSAANSFLTTNTTVSPQSNALAEQVAQPVNSAVMPNNPPPQQAPSAE